MSGITKCDRLLLQSASGITKCDSYYKVQHNRTTPGVSLYHQNLTLEKNIVAVITQDKEIDNNLKRQIKNPTLCTSRLFPLT